MKKNMWIVVGALLLASVCGCETDAVSVTKEVIDDSTNTETTRVPESVRSISLPSQQAANWTREHLQDWDHDGFIIDEDCDDKNSDVYPGAYEWCDYIDNNCNGQTDESWKQIFAESFGMPCFAMGTNGCKTKGIWMCDFSRDWIACNAPPRDPSMEVCNGEDDDCNGVTDTDEWPHLGEVCEFVTENDCTSIGVYACNSKTYDAYCTGEDIPIPPEKCPYGE